MAKRRKAKKSRRKTYRLKRTAKAAARGREIYRVKGPPAGWRISRGRKVRGKRGRAQRRRKRRKVKKRRRKRRGNPNPYVCGYE